MNHLEGFLLLSGIPVGLLLAGYWLAASFAESEVSTRLSIGLLAGIGSLLLAVSLVNYFAPLSGLAAWLCLSPMVVTLIFQRSRRALTGDLRVFLSSKTTWACSLVVVLFLVILLWPALSSFTTVMYDGTSNHDSFFWVAVAEHLKRHTYMEQPLVNPLQPLASAADAVVGWRPAWGRMGSEGLIALCSAIVGLSPLKLYIYVTACLIFPWLAAVHLAIRTFYAERLAWPAQVAVLGLHPIFIFFYINSNLPNLLGVIAGSTAVIATASALRVGSEHRGELLAWSALLALALHGLYCAYSEMIPFVLLPCGLLWLRATLGAGFRAPWRAKLMTAGAVVLSLLLNPVSTLRAGWGFYAAYQSARADDRWGNIMDLLHPAQYLPALGTLSPPAAKWIGPWWGGAVTLVIAVGLGLAWRRARDPVGALLACAGGTVLLCYTLLFHFVYGWQKSVQFSGIFVSAIMAGAIIDSLGRFDAKGKLARASVRVGAVALGVFLAFAVGMQCRELYKWSERKLISQDWFVLREQSRTTLRAQPVLVEAASFRMAFFHSMWAAYFLPDSHLYFAARGEQSGGYLRHNVVNEATNAIPPSAAVLVSRPWAEGLDANSPRILAGREYVLLRESNRLFATSGLYPLNGPPEKASTEIELEILPHSAAQLYLEMMPEKPEAWPTGFWQVTRRAATADDFAANLSGPPPWALKVPLVPGQRNHLNLSMGPGKPAEEPWPFFVRVLRIEKLP